MMNLFFLQTNVTNDALFIISLYMQCIAFNVIHFDVSWCVYYHLEPEFDSTAMGNDCRFYYCTLLIDLLLIYTSSGFWSL